MHKREGTKGFDDVFLTPLVMSMTVTVTTMVDDDGESAAVDLVEQVQGARCINAMSSVCLLSSQQGGVS